MRRHLVLVGLPGAGKSTVGELVARELNTSLVDVDSTIERATSSTISEIFQREGEARFRARERKTVDGALGGKPCVVVPGGGWAAHPGNLERAQGRALLVYLSVSPEEAAGLGRPL